MLHTSGMDTNRPAKTPLQRDIDSGAYAAQEEKTMTTHPQHTSTPWRVHSGNQRGIYGPMNGGPDELLASTYMRKDEEHSESKEGEANAAFIVRAVNLFDRLLAEHKSDRHHAEICSICREAQA